MRMQGAPKARDVRALVILTVAFVLAGLATSRFTLVLHEFIGHGGAVITIGGDVVDHRLFLFGGGWVRYARAEGFSAAESLYLSLAGVGLEVLLGVCALGLARRLRPGSVGRLAALAFGSLDLLHAGFYVAAGTHHGFGDGLALHRALGEARAALVWPLAAAVVAGGFFAAVRLARAAAPWLPEAGRGPRLAALLAAAALAAAAHGGLALAEQELTDDPTYAEIMQHQAERDAERALARYLEVRQRRGVEIDREALAAERRRLVEERRPFPLKTTLAVLLGACACAGAWAGAGRRGSAAREGDRSFRDLLGLALVCAASLLLVLLLRRPWWG